MGANKDSDRQICGNIFINIKTIKNKNKVFTFHCVFCSTNCDQLKKFSKHLEEHLHRFEDETQHEKLPHLLFEPEEYKVQEHLAMETYENPLEAGKSDKVVHTIEDERFSDETEEEPDECPPTLLFEPEEIKVEERLDMEAFDEGYNKSINTTTSSVVYEDPLETGKSEKSLIKSMCVTKEFVPADVKIERDSASANKEEEICDTTSNRETQDNATNYIEEANMIIEESGEKSDKQELSFDELSDDSIDEDFNPTKSDNSSNKNKVTKKSSDTNKTKKRRRTIFVKILPSLIKLYKKYEILWQVDNISFGVKKTENEVYMKIVDELKLEHDVSITLEDINYHINYLNELYSKDKEKELMCKMEDKEFVPKYKHYKEMSFLNDSQGPFLCTICNQLLPKYESYCLHIAQHNGTKPFKCPSCAVTFVTYHTFLTHKKRHLGIYNFHCHICGKGYSLKNDLEWHVTSHTGDKPYLCQICGTGFRARHGYDNHIRRHEERFRHECHICKRGFNQLHALNSHVKSHLNIRDIICKICGKGFVHKKNLKRHQLIHGDVKNYKCSECGKAFFQACGLRVHRKNHHS